jgi:hypothetical protein
MTIGKKGVSTRVKIARIVTDTEKILKQICARIGKVQ